MAVATLMKYYKQIVFASLTVCAVCFFVFRLKYQRNYKKILYWTSYYHSDEFVGGFGSKPFEQCEVSNCFSTNDRSILPIEKFDAILFHGPVFIPKMHGIPDKRGPNQHYVFLDHEGPMKFPIFSNFSHLINITISHRLDSDVVVPYFGVYNMKDELIAPAFKPNWIQPNFSMDHLEIFSDIYDRKSKPIAWIVSNCNDAFNQRQQYVLELQKYISVDVYGFCGKYFCAYYGHDSCDKKLRNDYFFYLSFENSNCIDYVSEKIATAITNEIVPIVMNGANMTRMLPNYSYIDAREYRPKKLADYLKFLMAEKTEYLRYHWWRQTYYMKEEDVVVPPSKPMCALCEFLNGPEATKHKSYADLYKWYVGSKGNQPCFRAVFKNDNYSLHISPDTYYKMTNHNPGVDL